VTRSELMTLVRANIGGRTDKDTIIVLAFKLGLDEILKRHAFRVLREEDDLDVHLNDTFVNLPAETIGIREARLINGNLSYPIQIQPKTRVVETYSNVVSMTTGQPVIGYYEGGALNFIPPSDNDYVIRVSYNKRFTYFVDDTSVTEAPIDGALISWVTAYIWQSMGSSIQYQNWMRRFENDILSAIRSDNRQPGVSIVSEASDDGPPVTTATPWLDPFNKRGY
jgi:hypothetical protein